MQEGAVVAILTTRARATTRVQWEKDLDGIWNKLIRIYLAQPGCLGIQALWNVDNNREVLFVGLWDTLENRLAYEQSVARQARDLSESITKPPHPRPKYIISRAAYTPALKMPARTRGGATKPATERISPAEASRGHKG